MIKLTKVSDPGHIEGEFTIGRDPKPFHFSARVDLFLIQAAWYKGMKIEDLADGFGPGQGTHGDWSAIRDSSEGATMKMFERAINFFELDF